MSTTDTNRNGDTDTDLLSRRGVMRLAASMVPVVMTANVLHAEPPTTRTTTGAGASMLRSCFLYGTSTRPRLMATGDMLCKADGIWTNPDPAIVRLREEMAASYDAKIERVRTGHQAAEPEFSFLARSLLFEGVLSYALMDRAGRATAAQRGAIIGAAMDLVDALERGGKQTIDLHVGQASNMMPLAVAYDYLWDHLSPDQRRTITRALLNYSVRPTLEALYGYDERAWWVTKMNNWTTICIGGAIAAVLALREQDDPGPYAVQVSGDGKRVTRAYADHAHDLLTRGLHNLRRPWIQLASNNGLWGEGAGYQHDAMLPLFATVASVESALAHPDAAPPVVRQFLADAKTGAAAHVRSGLHLSSPLGPDFAYSDGSWELTDQPINLLIADYARRAGNPQWRAAAWQATRRGGKSERAMHLLYRAQFDWQQSTATPSGMRDFDISTAPTSVYFFDHKAVLPPANVPIPNPHVAIWRQNWTDPLAAAVMFKGGDNRTDDHSHLDVGTFTYQGQGVTWAVDMGRAEGYVMYHRDGIKNWKPNTVVLFQAYPKRACGHNTLVMNSASNDYTRRTAPAPWDWLWQINPDQALHDPEAWSAVRDIRTADADGIWSAAVDLMPVYRRHGAAAGSTRQFEFDRASGALTITDRLAFDGDTNDLWWFMHVAASTNVVHADPRRIVFAAKQADGTAVYCELELIDAPTAASSAAPGLRFGRIDENLPPGQPGDRWLWGHQNADRQKQITRKVALHCPAVGREGRIVTRLLPRPEWAGKTAENVRSALQAPSHE